MTFKKLLAATSITAISVMTAASASAISISGVSPAGIVPALELELPGTPALSANYAFSLDVDTIGGFFPAGNNVAISITLPAGVTFSAPVGTTITVGGSTGVTVQGDGLVGDSRVDLLVTPGAGISSLVFGNLSLGLSSCPTQGSLLEVTAIIDGSGTPIEGGVATSAGLIAPCESALDGVVTSDETVVGQDTFVTLNSGFQNIGQTAGGLGSTGPESVGTVEYTVDPAVSTSIAALAPLTPADVAMIDFDVVFGVDVTEIASVAVTGCTTTGPVGNVFSLSCPGAAIVNAGPLSVDVAVTGTNPLPSQSVSVGNALVTFIDTATLDLIDDEAGAVGPLDTLQREGKSFGSFDWLGGMPTSTENVFRVTGFSDQTPVDYTVTMTNSDLAPFGSISYSGTATPGSFGEVVLTATTGFGGIVPAFIRGDALVNFETLDNIDVDRLMIRNGIVSSFGDGANRSDGTAPNQPDSDSDQTDQSE